MDSRSVTVDYQEAESLLGGPAVGRLLLAGVDSDGRQWVAGVSKASPGLPEDCFFLPSQGRVAGEWIETTSGFRLKKAPQFVDVRDPASDEFTSDRGGFCLNSGGEVTRYEG